MITSIGAETRGDPTHGDPTRGDDALARADAARASATPAANERGPSSWRRWLSGGSPREVLARIVHDDPLRVRDHVANVLRERALLLDADRVHVRSLATVARCAPAYRGQPELSTWLDARVREAIDRLLDELLEGAHDDSPDCGAAFEILARPLGLDSRAMARACIAFNGLAQVERRAFFDLVIHGRSLEELVAESGESATEIARRARRALDTLLRGPLHVSNAAQVSNAAHGSNAQAEEDAPRSRNAAPRGGR